MHRFYMIQSFTQFHRNVSITYLYWWYLSDSFHIAVFLVVRLCHWTKLWTWEFKLISFCLCHALLWIQRPSFPVKRLGFLVGGFSLIMKWLLNVWKCFLWWRSRVKCKSFFTSAYKGASNNVTTAQVSVSNLDFHKPWMKIQSMLQGCGRCIMWYCLWK